MNRSAIRNGLLSALFSILGLIVLGQTTVTGTIRDDKSGETLVGATVILKGTTNGVVTDINGKFSIETEQPLPITLVVSFIGYISQEVTVETADQKVKVSLKANEVILETVEIVDSRITDKQKESPTTVESMDIIAIKETPAASFYDGLGALKGVDLTSASMGFKVVNTRGFNSTRPVRSLQIVDGADNQAPGLNFSIGNFVGASELDVQKVELIVGANSALYGPNAFNGVISMETKDPFIHRGLSVLGKVGERNLRETAIRYAKAFQNSAGEDKFAFKLNFSYMEADDWEATNLDATEQSNAARGNFGGYDAVNRYGDEDPANNSNNFLNDLSRRSRPGLGVINRTGYEEVDLVDYDTDNLKLGTGLYYKLPSDVTISYNYNYGTGTTVYQGDNRISLNGITIQQHRGEVKKEDKFFLRAYHTREDAGDSYDAFFTALLLQEASKPSNSWTQEYITYWQQEITPRVQSLPGFPDPNDPQFTQLWFGESRFATFALADSVMLANSDSLIKWHQEARDAADGEGNLGLFEERYEPGTARFDSLFNAITTSNVFTEGGSGFYDKSTLTHIQGEYKFTPKPFSLLLGGSYRQYNPDSRGTIFLDTGNVTIRNREFGFYGSIEKRVLDSTLILTASGRVDKNENFDLLGSPAVSAVYLADKDNTFRLSFSSAIRNPTLQDQYLFYNAGRAILIGNLNGFENLVTVPSLFAAFSGIVVDMDSLVYIDVDPVRPEKVRTIEVGYKGTIMKNLWVDVSYYYSWYEDFLGFKVGADVTLDTNFNQITVDNIYRVTANSPDVVVTQGFSLGMNYYFGDYYALNGNYSWNKLDRRGSDDEIIPAFNTPEHKFNIGVSGRDIMGQLGPVRLRHWGFNVNYKWVDGFVFEGSPQFTGFVPSYGLLDAQVNKKVPSIKSVFKLGASNLLNNEVFQTVGGPFIGRMLYFSVLVELDKL